MRVYVITYVCVCACVCYNVCVCVCVCMSVYICIHLYTDVCLFIHEYVQVYIYIFILLWRFERNNRHKQELFKLFKTCYSLEVSTENMKTRSNKQPMFSIGVVEGLGGEHFAGNFFLGFLTRYSVKALFCHKWKPREWQKPQDHQKREMVAVVDLNICRYLHTLGVRANFINKVSRSTKCMIKCTSTKCTSTKFNTRKESYSSKPQHSSIQLTKKATVANLKTAQYSSLKKLH